MFFSPPGWSWSRQVMAPRGSGWRSKLAPKQKEEQVGWTQKYRKYHLDMKFKENMWRYMQLYSNLINHILRQDHSRPSCPSLLRSDHDFNSTCVENMMDVQSKSCIGKWYICVRHTWFTCIWLAGHEGIPLIFFFDMFGLICSDPGVPLR